MDQQTYNSNPSLGPQLSTTIREAAVFLQNIDNTKKTWRGLSYPEVFDLVKNFVQAIETESNLENISVENLISLLNKIFAEEEHLESIVPQNLQTLLQELEEAEGKAKIFEQKAAKKVENFLEERSAFLEKRQKQQSFIKATEELITTTAQKFSLGLPDSKQEQVAKAIVDEIAVQTSPEFSFKKISELPLKEKEKEEQKIIEQIRNSFKEALPPAIAKLRNKGMTIAPEEETVLSRIVPSTDDLPLIIQQLTLPTSDREEMSTWFKQQLAPLASSKEAQTMAETFVPAIVEKLPEISPKAIDQLTEKQFLEIKTQFEEATIMSLAEVAPEIGELSPQKVGKAISTFTPQNKEELRTYATILTTPEENRSMISVLAQEPEKEKGRVKIFEQKEDLLKTTTQKLSQGLPADKLEIVTQAVIKEIDVRPDLALALNKASSLSPAKRQVVEQKIAEQIQTSFKQAAPFVVSKLRNQGVVVTSGEEEILSRITPSLEELPLITNQLTLPAPERKEMASWLKEQLLPVAPLGEARQIAEALIPTIVEKLPEIDPKTIDQITEKQFAEIKTQFEEAVVATLAEVAPKIGEISPQNASRIIATFIPQNKEELKKYSPLLTLPKGKTVIAPPLSTEPIEVTQLPTKLPRFLASPFRRTTEGNIWHTQNEKGVRFIDELRTKLFQEGINKGNSLGFRSKVLERWALYLTSEKITPEDIDHTIEELLNAGESKDSPRIRELRETHQALAQFQQTLPASLLEKIKKENALEGKKGSYFVQIPSRFGTTVIRKVAFNPKLNLATRINSFLGRAFGKQTIISSSGQIVYINKIAFLGHRVFEAIKTRFFNTSVGQGVKTVLLQLGQKGLQTLWNTAKTGITKAISTILTKIGLQAVATVVAPVIGNLIAFVASKLLKRGSSLLKRGVGWITSGFGISDAIFGGLTGQREISEDKSLAFLRPLFVGLFAVMFFLSIFNTVTTGGAFIGTKNIGTEEGISLPPGVEPNCSPSRHLAEEIICKLSKGNSPCNHFQVDENTWNDVSVCLTQSTLPNKETIKNIFSRYVIPITEGGKRNLECVGFVVGAEAGLGRNAERPGGGNARDYLNSPYPNHYQFIDGKGAKPQVGDIAIWKGKTYGHIAIVISTDGNLKITIAESDGYNGIMSIRENIPSGNPDTDGNASPNGFLRYIP